MTYSRRVGFVDSRFVVSCWAVREKREEGVVMSVYVYMRESKREKGDQESAKVVKAKSLFKRVDVAS